MAGVRHKIIGPSEEERATFRQAQPQLIAQMRDQVEGLASALRELVERVNPEALLVATAVQLAMSSPGSRTEAEYGTFPGRNDPCYCGSGKKYKHCCLAKDEKRGRGSSFGQEQTTRQMTKMMEGLRRRTKKR